jgi:hypothetical protein
MIFEIIIGRLAFSIQRDIQLYILDETFHLKGKPHIGSIL